MISKLPFPMFSSRYAMGYVNTRYDHNTGNGSLRVEQAVPTCCRIFRPRGNKPRNKPHLLTVSVAPSQKFSIRTPFLKWNMYSGITCCDTEKRAVEIGLSYFRFVFPAYSVSDSLHAKGRRWKSFILLRHKKHPIIMLS